MITPETLSARVGELKEETVKQLADPDADKNAVPYLRGALGAFLLVSALLTETNADENAVNEMEESS